MLEEIPLLQRLDGLLVGGRSKMIVTGVVAGLHAAVDDLSPQLGIVVERGDEPADFPMAFLRGAVGKLIFDHEMFHRLLLSAYFRKGMPSDLIRGWIPVLRSGYAQVREVIRVDTSRKYQERRSQIFGGGVSPRNTAALRLANSSNEVGGHPSSASASGQTFASLPLRRSANNSNKASAR